jgi:hypothetical protein
MYKLAMVHLVIHTILFLSYEDSTFEPFKSALF